MQQNPKIVTVKRLIWAYFLLWLFEGVLRKWVLPSIAGPLVFVRDLALLALYAQAINARIFRVNSWLVAWAILGLVAVLAGFIVLPNALVVVLYGYRTNFMHVPLIFLIPQVFTASDVRKIGYFTLALALPMGLLMFLQFRAGPGDFLNAGAGEGAEQIAGALGHVRASGTFSFVLGPAYFFPLVTAFLMHGQFTRGVYPRWLLASAFIGVFLGAICSISRILVANVLFVVLFGFVAVSLMNIKVAVRWLAVATIGLVVVGGIVSSQFTDAVEAFSQRLDEAGNTESDNGGFLGRVLYQFNTPFTGSESQQDLMLGRGLGMGTNFAAIYLTGERQFLLAETEWQRVYLESGLVVGGAIIFYRVALIVWLAIDSLRCGKRRDTLPLLLFSSCALIVTNGQWGLPTALGIACFGAGLTLAAIRSPYTALAAAQAPAARRRRLFSGRLAPLAARPNEAG